jgi:hypothetical protein
LPSGHACQLCRIDRQLLAAADGLDGFNVFPDRLGKKTGKPGRESLIEQNSGPELALRNHNWRFIPGQAGDKAARRDLAELDRPSAAAGDRNLPPPPGQLYDLAGELHYDLWIGPAPWHPYNHDYFGGCLKWNMFWDFGSWQVGEMGSHTMDLAWNAIDAELPISAEAHGDPVNPDVAPSALTMTF